MMNHSLCNNPNDDIMMEHCYSGPYSSTKVSLSHSSSPSAACSSQPPPCHYHGPLSSTVSEDDILNQKRSVRFSTVQILEFPLSLGRCSIPSSGGAPIGLNGFKACRKIKYDLDLFEVSRCMNRRSTRNEFHLSVETRSRLLLKEGFTLQEILQATLEGFNIQQDRIETEVITKLEESRKEMMDEKDAGGSSSRGVHRNFLARAFVLTKRNLIKSIRRT